jgi:hypothetical protein
LRKIRSELQQRQRPLLGCPLKRQHYAPGQHLGGKLRRLASLRDHLDERWGQERQPNEPSDIAHADPFLRCNRGERCRPSRGRPVEPPARAANRPEQGEVDFGPRSVSARYHQPQLHAAPLYVERDEARDDALLKAVARARQRSEDLLAGRAQSVAEIAQRERVGARYLRRLLRLAFLAPDIVETIATGYQPPELTAEALAERIDLPLLWTAQAKAAGIAS